MAEADPNGGSRKKAQNRSHDAACDDDRPEPYFLES
jgi:hypothetical protein